MSPTARYDTIVIGAGLSGLAAGIRLAQYERSVLIVEKHSLWGGLNSYYKRRGRRIDTGLHALTNFVPRNARGAPLSKILRQLRIDHDELQLSEQSFSQIVFPQARLRFANRFALLREDVQAAFPTRIEAFDELVRAVRQADPFVAAPAAGAVPRGARSILSTLLDEPLLVDMLLVPICYYGSAVEGDIDWNSFVILFRSIFFEGFARPEGGIRRILDVLVGRYRELGGELCLRTGVERILCRSSGAYGVVLEGGREVLAERILSSAGYVETMQLCGRKVDPADIGRLSFVESIKILDQPLARSGHHATITFFNTGERFEYRRPQALVDPASGVLCCSDNYLTPTPPTEGVLRVTLLANHDAWCSLDAESYSAAKAVVREQISSLTTHLLGPLGGSVVFEDLFTPRTIRQFTGHVQGAVYGSPHKRPDGDCGIQNLNLIGTDQGLVGVIGALLSGITMANRHVLAVADR